MRASRSFWFVPVAAMLLVAGCGGGDAASEADAAAIPVATNPGAANPSDAGYWEPQTGDSFGRKFKIIHFRWLSADEV